MKQNFGRMILKFGRISDFLPRILLIFSGGNQKGWNVFVKKEEAHLRPAIGNIRKPHTHRVGVWGFACFGAIQTLSVSA